MATAYAALLSLINTISLERASGPSHPPFPFDTSLIDALLERVEFFVEFLEKGWEGSQHLLGRITDLAYAAEDAIESPIVDAVLANFPTASNSNDKKPPHLECRITDLAYSAEDAIESPIIDTVVARSPTSSSSSGKGPILTFPVLEKIIQDMDSIKAKIKEDGIKNLQLGNPNSSIASNGAAPLDKNKMVGFEEEKIRIMEVLVRLESRRLVISIHGMGGSGKTTLAQTIYDHPCVIEYFDVRVWVTVSQEYSSKKMLKQILSCLNPIVNDAEDEDDLGKIVYQTLFSRRYFVIFDDIWNIDAWDSISRFFPENSNGSRIILTTRLFNLANIASPCSFGMKPLDADSSWKLLCEKVFGQGNCPLELEQVGKQIAQNCRGLPLTISIIGGLLAKSNPTLQYWNNVVQDFSSYLDNDDHCSKILSLSYNHLPIHLKPCFLCMGVFPEDHEIDVVELINLWIAEGFLKPHGEKILEDIGEEYLRELTERNLINMNYKLGTETRCTIHDLLRELCRKEAQKDSFYCVVTHNSLSVPLSLHRQRRLVLQLINESDQEIRQDIVHSITDCLPSTSQVRSLISSFDVSLSEFCDRQFSLLRIFYVIKARYGPFDKRKNEFNLVNLRYHKGDFSSVFTTNFLSDVCAFRNMQVQHITRSMFPTESSLVDIWNWPQIRNLHLNLAPPLPEPPSSPQEDYIILEKLQTIRGLVNFELDAAVCKRIPNVKTLELHYTNDPCDIMSRNQVAQLQKLESFTLRSYFPRNNRFCLHNGVLPHSLKELRLYGTRCSWEKMTVIGSLPNLEVLHLEYNSFVGQKWNPVEGEFLQLKLLEMYGLSDLVYWNVDSTHFPVLEELFLDGVEKLTEIPLDIGEITTLRMIKVKDCIKSVVISAKNILHEQRSLGNDTLECKITRHRL